MQAAKSGHPPGYTCTMSLHIVLPGLLWPSSPHHPPALQSLKTPALSRLAGCGSTNTTTYSETPAEADGTGAMANADPKLASVRLTELPDIATLRIDMDQQKLAALGLTQSAANNTLVSRSADTAPIDPSP